MTSEEKVRAAYPKATKEIQRGAMKGDSYYLIRAHRGAHMYIGWGKTLSAAWVDAAKGLPQKEKEA